MQNKTKWVVASLMAAALMFIYRPDRTELQLNQLDLPDCAQQTVFTTNVTFFIQESVSSPELEAFLRQSIDYGNQVLTNSCIPMRRQVASFQTVNLDLTGTEDIHQVHSRLKAATRDSVLRELQISLNDYYVVVLPSDHGEFATGTSGVAAFGINDSYVMLSESASKEVLEHELGHLAWAQHKDTVPFPSLQGNLKLVINRNLHHKIKRYARGYKCANAGTIMSYEDKILPIYSSPEIFYRGHACGDEETADNRRVLIEYAQEQLSQLKKGI